MTQERSSTQVLVKAGIVNNTMHILGRRVKCSLANPKECSGTHVGYGKGQFIQRAYTTGHKTPVPDVQENI